MAGVWVVVRHPLDTRSHTYTRTHAHARRRAHVSYVRTRAWHGKHQINHLINFAEVVVVVMVAAAAMVVVNSKRLVRYFAVTFTSAVNDG